jgi:enamine deaminase RidA (YjgF/YER057c/UK114 family)
MKRKQSIDTGTVWEKLAGFSRAVRIGDIIAVSGTTATDETGNMVGAGDAAAQTNYIIDKIERTLARLGVSLDHVIRTRIYVNALEDWEAVARVHGERFASIRPANTLVEAKLVGEGYLVEMEADAVV